MNNKRRAGFSMVEVIISLAIIVMISITAISITLSSIANRMTIVNRTHGQYFADNVWECFKAAKDNSEFANLLGFAYPGQDDDTSDVDITPDGDGKYTVESTRYKFTATVNVTYVENERPTLFVEVKELDDDEIISFTYTKGAEYENA